MYKHEFVNRNKESKASKLCRNCTDSEIAYNHSNIPPLSSTPKRRFHLTNVSCINLLRHLKPPISTDSRGSPNTDTTTSIYFFVYFSVSAK